MLTAEAVQSNTDSVSLVLDAIQVCAPDGRSLVAASYVRFRPGVTALIGSNGTGKSTLLRTLATLHPVTGGSILLDGLDGTRDRRAFLDHIVFLPQNFATYPDLTGREFLSYALRLRGASRAEARSTAAAWLDAVGLRRVADMKTGAYSQGMRQRLGFAYAMQLDVTLYLLDEPFAGVDPESRSTMTDILFRVGGQRIVLVSTHHVDEMIARGSAIARITGGMLITE
jgi:ABC-type multidrug transport system ATPase subunit